jgi:hypothetical protein
MNFIQLEAMLEHNMRRVQDEKNQIDFFIDINTQVSMEAVFKCIDDSIFD